MSGSVYVRFLLAAACLLLPAPTGAGHGSDLVHRYVSCALQGDLTPVPELFASASRELTDEESHLRDQWQARFVDRTDKGPLPDLPPFERDVLETYRNYWARVLTGELDNDSGETFLSAGLARLLVEHLGVEDPPRDEAMDLVQKAIEKDGFHLITGITRPWFELMLWADQDTLHYDVELTDGIQPVTVVMMGDFQSRGWSDFATFGRASTGGWATSDALFFAQEFWRPAPPGSWRPARTPPGESSSTRDSHSTVEPATAIGFQTRGSTPESSQESL